MFVCFFCFLIFLGVTLKKSNPDFGSLIFWSKWSPHNRMVMKGVPFFRSKDLKRSLFLHGSFQPLLAQWCKSSHEKNDHKQLGALELGVLPMEQAAGFPASFDSKFGTFFFFAFFGSSDINSAAHKQDYIGYYNRIIGAHPAISHMKGCNIYDPGRMRSTT